VWQAQIENKTKLGEIINFKMSNIMNVTCVSPDDLITTHCLLSK
jgi:hypothetical protein